MFWRQKREIDTVDRRVYYTLCRDVGLAGGSHIGLNALHMTE